MSELKWFRLIVFAVAVLLIVGGSTWAYSTLNSFLEQREVVRWAEQDRKAMDSCFARGKSATIEQCRNPHWARLLDIHADAQGRHEERAEIALWATLVSCTSLVVAFYGLRWALTGRVRPFWLLSRIRPSNSDASR